MLKKYISSIYFIKNISIVLPKYNVQGSFEEADDGDKKKAEVKTVRPVWFLGSDDHSIQVTFLNKF